MKRLKESLNECYATTCKPQSNVNTFKPQPKAVKLFVYAMFPWTMIIITVSKVVEASSKIHEQ